jgi:translocation and assembly module TamB
VSTTPNPAPAPLQPRHISRNRSGWRRFGRIVLYCFVGVVVLLGIAFWYANTASFANHVRTKLIDVLTTATGGRVELAKFRWRPLHLEAEVDGLTIHGLEAPGEVPYAHVDTLRVQAKIIDLFKAQVGLRWLEVEHPVFHMIVYPDGSTNQPVPKKKSQSNTSVTDTIFDLQANRTEVNNGVLLLNQRALPFNVAAKNLVVTVTYRPQQGARGALEARPECGDGAQCAEAGWAALCLGHLEPECFRNAE